jgi:PAS domain S-box-containing protein
MLPRELWRVLISLGLKLEGGVAMLRKLSEKAQTCLDRALDAKRKADRAIDATREAEFRQIEKSWRALAESYELTERLTDFTAENANWRRRFNERRRVRARQDDEVRLQKIIQEGNVEALFERMWLSSIVEFSDDAIISKSLDGIITSWNKGAEQLFGYLAEEAIGKPVVILAPPERRGEDHAILEHVRRGDRVHNYETVRQRKDGSLIDVSVTVSPIRGAGARVVGASRVVRDISERKRSEAHISVLTHEAEHRAKNLLANVKAMVRLSQSDTPEGLKKIIEGRIEALANVHSLFVQSRWTGAELGSLVRQELSPYSQTGETRTLINGPAVILKPDVAQAMAVALHELATNAAKYGALSVTTGQVRVEWSHGEDGQLVLCWTETGGPPVNLPTRRGFGTRALETMIRDGVNGRVQLDWHAEGVDCEIAVPT